MRRAFQLLGEISLSGGRQVERGLENINRSAENTGREMSRFGRLMGSVGRATAAGIGIAAGAAATGLAALGGVVSKTGIEFNAMKEQSQVAWTTLLGGADAADAMIEKINQFAAATPFAVENVDMMAKHLHNAGLQGQEMFDELMQISDVSSAFALPAHEAEELTRQMSQVRQAGVAYTEDLNVLQDRGVPIYKAISEQLGITVADVKEMASEGELTADIYNSAFDSIANSVKGASEAQSKTFTGMISTLKDNMNMLFGEVMEGSFERLKTFLPPLIDFIGNLKDTIDESGIRGAMEKFLPPELVSFIDAAMTNIQKAFNTLSNSGGQIQTFFERFTYHLQVLKTIALAVFNMVFPFIKAQIADLRAFWDQNGAAIMKAVENAFTFVKTVVNAVMPAVLFIIRMVWDSIAGIIRGVLGVIKGLILVFTGIFTGDFSRMWEGIKLIFFGAIEAVWNYLNLLFFGRILGGIKALVIAAGKNIVKLWTSIVNATKSGVNSAITFVQTLLNRAINVFNTLQRNGVGIFNSIRSAIGNIISDLKNIALRHITNFQTGAATKFGNILSTAKTIFGKIKTAIMNPIETAKTAIFNIVEKIRSKFNNLRIQLPHIKMPKFHIKNWSLNPKNWIKNPPSLGITWHARGGIFNSPSIVGLGESGREAILPLENRKYFQPFSQAIADNLAEISGDNGFNGRIEVPLFINSREFARAVARDIDRELNRNKENNYMGG